jgi:hypothetical protein
MGEQHYKPIAKQKLSIYHHLMSKGIWAGDALGLWMNRPVQRNIVVIMILRAGGAYYNPQSHSAVRMCMSIVSLSIVTILVLIGPSE